MRGEFKSKLEPKPKFKIKLSIPYRSEPNINVFALVLALNKLTNGRTFSTHGKILILVRNSKIKGSKEVLSSIKVAPKFIYG